MNRISIGILAHNEADSIAGTLTSLFEQTVMYGPDPVEVVVVANGCTDDTAARSRATLARLAATPHQGGSLSWSVRELREAGKSNAWNHFVHGMSDQRADYLFLMDADIQFLEPASLVNMVTALERNKEACISVDSPIKDLRFKEKSSLVESLSLAVTKASVDDRVWICGQLYCGRASVLRKIWLPLGLPVEDGFLWSMVTRDCFTSPPNPRRIVRAPGASHMFRAYTRPQELLRHEKRIILGMTINNLLCEHFVATSSTRRHAGEQIKTLNDQAPGWLEQFIEKSLAQKGWWVIPTEWLFRRFEGLKYVELGQAMLLTPAVFAALAVDLFVFSAANLHLRRGQSAGYW